MVSSICIYNISLNEVMSLSTTSMTGSQTTATQDDDLRHFSNTGLVDFAASMKPNVFENNIASSTASSNNWKAVVPVETNNEITFKFTPNSSNNSKSIDLCNNVSESTTSKSASNVVDKLSSLSPSNLAKLFVTQKNNGPQNPKLVNANANTPDLHELACRIHELEQSIMQQTEIICEQDLGLREHTLHLDNLMQAQNSDSDSLREMKTGLLDHKKHIEKIAQGLFEHKKHIESMTQTQQSTQKSIAAHSEKLSEMHDGLMSHSNALKSIKSGASNDSLRNSVSQLKKSMSSLQAKQNEMHTGLNNHTNVLKSLKGLDASKINSNIKEMQIGLKNHTDVLRELRSDSERHATGLLNHKNLLAELRNKI